MKIKNVMTPSPVTISANAKISEAAGLLRKHRIGAVPVVDGDEIVGIVTEADILSLLSTEEMSADLWLPSPLEVIEVPVRELVNWEKTKKAFADIGHSEVREVMTHNVISVSEDADIEEAAALMLREGIGRLPVIREGRLVGIVTRSDIVRGIGAAYEESQDEE